MKLIKLTTILLVIVSLSLTFASCKKPTSACANGVPALIIDGGPLSSDGCGWQVKVDSLYYHADSIPTAYQVNNLNVNINYTVDTSRHFRCGFASIGIPTITLTCITKQ